MRILAFETSAKAASVAALSPRCQEKTRLSGASAWTAGAPLASAEAMP